MKTVGRGSEEETECACLVLALKGSENAASGECIPRGGPVNKLRKVCTIFFRAVKGLGREAENGVGRQGFYKDPGRPRLR